MVNRVIQQKIIKMRRRNRYATFSGSDSVILMGKISLSKQVINRGLRVPGKNIPNLSLNQDRVPLNPKKDMVDEIPKQLMISMERGMAIRAAQLLKDQDLSLKRLIFDGRKVKVFIFFDLKLSNVYLVRIDYRLDKVERSCTFNSLSQAQDAYHTDRVVWLKHTVEHV